MKTFLVIKPKLMKLLLACRTTESTNYAMDFINISNNDLITTDGRQLVIIHSKKSLDLQDGFYIADRDINMIARGESEKKFPNCREIIPQNHKNYGYTENIKDIVKICTKTGLFIDWNTFSESFKALFDLDNNYEVFIKKTTDTLMLKGNYKDFEIIYLLMPLI